MVKVPRQNVVPSSVAPTFQTGVGAEAAFTGLGGAMKSAGVSLANTSNVISAIAHDRAVKEREYAVKDAQVKFDTAMEDLKSGENGWRRDNGQNALDRDKEHKELRKKARTEILKGMKPRAAKAFTIWSDFELNAVDGEHNAYIHSQREVVRKANDAARIEQTGEKIIEDPEGPDALKNWNEHMLAISSALDNAGIEGVAKEEAIEGYVSTIHEEIIRRRIIHDPEGAEAYYNENKGFINPAAFAGIESSLKSAGKARKTQAIVDEAYGKFADSSTKGLAWIRKNTSGDVEKDAIAEFKVRVAEARLAKAEVLDKLETKYMKEINSGMSLAQIRANDPEGWLELSGDSGAMERLRKARIANAEKREFGETTDVNTFRDIMNLSHEKRAKIDLEHYKTSMTRDDYNKLITAQAASRHRTTTTNDGERKAYGDMAKTIVDFSRSIELDGEKLGIGTQNESAQGANIRDAGDRWVAGFIQQNDRVPTKLEINDEARRLLLPVQGDASGLWWDDFHRLAVNREFLTQKQRDVARVVVKQIPLSMKKSIVQMLRANNIKPTDDLLENIAGARAMIDDEREAQIVDEAR